MEVDRELGEIAPMSRVVFCGTVARTIAEATDNRFQIHPFAASAIVAGRPALDALSNGTVAACRRHVPATSLLGVLPNDCFRASLLR